MTDTATTPAEAPNVPVAFESVTIPVPAELKPPQTEAPAAAPEPQTKAESEPPAPEASKDGDQPKDERKNSARERIARLTAEKYAALAKAAAAEADARSIREEVKKLRQTPIEQLPFEQQTAAQVQDALKVQKHEDNIKEAERARQEALRATIETFNAKSEDARSRIQDFDAVVSNPNLKISPEMLEVIAESDRAPEIAYYLGKNPHEAAQIASLPSHLQGARLAQIEAKVSVPARKVSTAPAPVPTIAAASAGPVVKDPANMSMSEFAEWARKDGMKSILR